MTAKRAALVVTALLMLLGAICVGVRREFRQKEPMARGDSIWQLTYTASFHVRKPDAKVRVSFPLDTQYARVDEYKIVEPGLSVKRLKSANGEARDMIVEPPKTGVCRMTAQTVLHVSQRPGWRKNLPGANLSPKDRARLLGNERGIEATDPAIQETLQRLRGKDASKTDLVEQLYLYCFGDIRPGGESAPQEAAAALAKGVASPLGCARAMVALCRAAKIPARLVTGFEIEKGDDVRPHTWVEVLSDDQWEPYDPEEGYLRKMPPNFVPVRREGVEVIRSAEVSDLTAGYAIAPMPPPPGSFNLEHRSAWDILDLPRLPVQMHDVLEVILLLPLGGLVTAFVRTIVGLRTFGTFTPTLLALAFVYNDQLMGILVLLAVIVLGFSSRAFLDRLKLLLVPRLGIILTLVVLCIVFSISMLDYFGRAPGAKAVLLPMVIMTMLVERFYVTTEEDSLAFAVQLLAGTLALAAVVYALLRWKTVGRTLLFYPELHLFTVAALIVVGRYTGYRWTELWRFRDLPGAETVKIDEKTAVGWVERSEPHQNLLKGLAMFEWGPLSWVTPQELRRAGVLGINRRNSEYVLPNNPRRHYPRVDDKYLTKEICHQRQIPVPETYALIERHGDVPKFLDLMGRREEFVIKPASGSEGRGIMVIARHNGSEFFSSSEERWLLADMTYHLMTILSGLYSLAGQPDRIIIEHRILRHPVFEAVAVGGTPDVRIVLYRCVPVMAMVRLPTRESRGRANLHQGAVGVGVHLGSGRTHGGVCKDRAVSIHPDTGVPVAGLTIPAWHDLLVASMKLADALEMGYLGVDFVLDADDGPVVLEANARPGLNIQVANRCGLLPRLRWIDAQPPERLAAENRMDLVAAVADMT